MPELNPPSVTPDDILRETVSVNFLNVGAAIRAAGGTCGPSLDLLTLCLLELRNGFTIVGTSACVSPAKYNEAIGRDLALKDAYRQVWPLLGFRLADQLAQRDDDAPLT